MRSTLAFLDVTDRQRLERLARTQGTTGAALARDAVRILLDTCVTADRERRAEAKPRRGTDVRPSVRPSVQTACQPTRSLPDVSARRCAECGEPLPPQGRGRPRVRHEACGGKTQRGTTQAVIPPPRRVEDEFEVAWNGTQGRQGKSLVGDINRKGCSLAQP